MIVLLPVGFIVFLLWLAHRRKREALHEAADILGLEAVGSPASVPRLEGEIDGMPVVAQATTVTWSGVLESVFFNLVKHGFGGHEAAPRGNHLYDGRWGPLVVRTEPYGLPPEVEVIPREPVGPGELEGPRHSLESNIERVFHVESTDDRLARAVVEYSDVMEPIWALHREFGAARCEHGVLEVSLETIQSGHDLAKDMRSVVERSRDVGDAFREKPLIE